MQDTTALFAVSGTVNISRDIWRDTAFKAQPFTEREAFVWMIMEASYKARDRRVGNVSVHLERGQLASSIRFMADAWDWQKSTVDRFLKRLENRDMIGTDSGTGVNVITICKYDEYQSKPNESGTTEFKNRDSSGTAAGQQRDKHNKGLIPDEIRGQDTLFGEDAPKPKKTKACRLSGDWFLPKAWGEWAASEGCEIEMIRIEADKFKDYWIGKAGASASKLDWLATWRNWIRSAMERTPKQKSTNGVHYDAAGNKQLPNGSGNRIDPALENILRLSGAGPTQGDGRG